MSVSTSRNREKKLRRDGTEKKRDTKKDWTKKKIKEITDVVHELTDEEFEDLSESLKITLSIKEINLCGYSSPKTILSHSSLIQTTSLEVSPNPSIPSK